MNDKTNLTQEAYQRAADVMVKLKQQPKAAGMWLKYNSNSVINPLPGEWCLWSVIIDGIWQCGYGSLDMNSTLLFITNGIGRFIKIEVDDTFYFAHINEMVLPNGQNDNE